MPGDNDLARLLPEPPPPRAVRREAAIDAAMRRFDGEAAAPVAKPVRAPVRTWLGRPQMAAFASVALVAVVGIPLALTVLEREHRATVNAPAPVVVVAKRTGPAPVATPVAVAPVADRLASNSVRRSAEPAAEAERGPETVVAPVVVTEDCGKGDCDVVHPPMNRFAQLKVRPAPMPEPLSQGFAANRAARSPAPDGRMADAAGTEITVTGSRIRSPAVASASNSVVTAVETSNSPSIVVTGARVRGPAAARRRGDWNACTINDPERSLAGCRRLIDPGAKGAKGEAAARVAEGLSRAWKGDMDEAIGEFDAAIALQPRLAIAYLNRGLAYRWQGDTERALADLDRAVRYAPSAARGYYNRSQVREQAGDTERARADADRAIEIDARYRAALE